MWPCTIDFHINFIKYEFLQLKVLSFQPHFWRTFHPQTYFSFDEVLCFWCEIFCTILQFLILTISQDFKFLSIESHVILLLPGVELVQVLLQELHIIMVLDRSEYPSVICEEWHITVNVVCDIINEYEEQDRFQHSALWNTTLYFWLTGLGTISNMTSLEL